MNKRTSIKDLEYLVKIINKKIGRKDYGVGHYILGEAYGGIRLEKIVNDGGSVVIYGYSTKRELESQLRAFIAGLSASSAVSK